MKLGRVGPPDLDGSCEPDTVFAPRDPQRSRETPRPGVRRHTPMWTFGSGIRRHTLLHQATLGQSRAHGPRYDRVIGVDEVEVRARRDAVEQPELAGVLHAVPSHVGNLPPGREPAHGAGDDVEPLSLAELL